MDILLNGDIYLKRGPSIFRLSTNQIESLTAKVEMLENSKKVPEDLLKSFKELNDGLINSEGKKDYSGCEEFWHLFVTDEGYELSSCGLIKKKRTYETIEELNKYFISLRKFLSQAEYVGRHFTYSKDSINREHYNFIVLYKTDNIWITYEENSIVDKNEYRIRFKNPNAGNLNYYVYGEVDNSFNDKTKVYQNIFKQLTDKTNKTL